MFVLAYLGRALQIYPKHAFVRTIVGIAQLSFVFYSNYLKSYSVGYSTSFSSVLS